MLLQGQALLELAVTLEMLPNHVILALPCVMP